MKLRLFPNALAAAVAVLAGCTSGSAPSTTSPTATSVADPAAFTVSYRNQVRLPWGGSTLTSDRFAKQLASKDPIGPVRCAAEGSKPYRDITEFLGGIEWTHPMAILKDASLPPLYDGKMDFSAQSGGAGGASAASPSAAPNIERPDLVGVNNGLAVFLSKAHGLIAVDARGTGAKPSCSMKLPGKPMNFFFKGDELVVVVNAIGGFNRSALLRYTFKGGTFGFVDAVPLPDQNIVDARLFDSTLVLYTNWSKAQKPTPIGEPSVGSGPQSSMYGGGAGGASAGAPSNIGGGGYGGDRVGAKVIVVQWDDALAVDWQDALVDDPKKVDPMEGIDPKTPLSPGQVVSTWKAWAGFVAASDRYLAIPRSVTRSKFSHYETYTYQVCTNYNPQDHQVEQCSVQYQKQPNPDYKAPDPVTGDYSCQGKNLADCIAQAAPVVSQYIWVPVGQTCSNVWVGACTAYETRSETYPAFDTVQTTELTIYKFENGSFTKFDNSLSTMSQKNDAIEFQISPLEVKGSITTRNQIQFQNGQLYVLADTALQTMSVAGNSVSYVNRLDISANTSDAPAVVFSANRAMISAYQSYNGSTQQSNVAMLDLTEPALPKALTSFTMPGVTTQLMLATGGILGPGQVSFTNGQVNRSLQKLTLFSNTNGSEADNLLLGTEYDTFESSWFAQEDDQRIRLGSNGARLFLPYSGQHHADQYAPTAHRLNITRIDSGRLVSERSFEVSDDIIRTAALDDLHSLVFGDSATYLVDHTSGDWAISTLRELFVPFATYRLSDSGLMARVDRVGSKCRVRTYASDADIFASTSLADANVSCGEGTLPTGFGSSILWASTQTGVSISADGKAINVMPQPDVAAALAKIPQNQYCYVDGGAAPQVSVATIDYLDQVPASIACASTQRQAGM